jgi:hypothetical protein
MIMTLTTARYNHHTRFELSLEPEGIREGNEYWVCSGNASFIATLVIIFHGQFLELVCLFYD